MDSIPLLSHQLIGMMYNSFAGYLEKENENGGM